MLIPFKSHLVEFNQQQLDTSSVESHYKLTGQNAYHPKQIISILIYALAPQTKHGGYKQNS